MCGNPVRLFCLGGRQSKEQPFDCHPQRACNRVYLCTPTDVDFAAALSGNLRWLALEWAFKHVCVCVCMCWTFSEWSEGVSVSMYQVNKTKSIAEITLSCSRWILKQCFLVSCFSKYLEIRLNTSSRSNCGGESWTFFSQVQNQDIRRAKTTWPLQETVSLYREWEYLCSQHKCL